MKFEKNLLFAIRDYKTFLEKEYSQKRILDLVADRYGLSQSKKAVLYRGVSTDIKSSYRSRKRFFETLTQNHVVKIDAINQLYTLASYLEGNLVFISSDGFLRDASEIHGKSINRILVQKSAELVFTYFKKYTVKRIEFFIDRQVNDNLIIEKILESVFSPHTVVSEIKISDHVDKDLKTSTESLIATSDSQIIVSTENLIFDLAFHVLDDKYSLNIPDIRLILSEMI